MKKTYYESIFILDALIIKDTENDSLVMCGKNWDYYFSKNDEKAQQDKISNVEILEFKNQNELDTYMASNKISSLNNVIDYSNEFGYPMVLNYV